MTPTPGSYSRAEFENANAAIAKMRDASDGVPEKSDVDAPLGDPPPLNMEGAVSDLQEIAEAEKGLLRAYNSTRIDLEIRPAMERLNEQKAEQDRRAKLSNAIPAIDPFDLVMGMSPRISVQVNPSLTIVLHPGNAGTAITINRAVSQYLVNNSFMALNAKGERERMLPNEVVMLAFSRACNILGFVDSVVVRGRLHPVSEFITRFRQAPADRAVEEMIASATGMLSQYPESFLDIVSEIVSLFIVKVRKVMSDESSWEYSLKS